MDVDQSPTFGIDSHQFLTLLGEISRCLQDQTDIHDQLAQVVQLTKTALQCDRTLVYRLLPNQDGVVAAEAVEPPWTAVLGQCVYDPCFQSDWQMAYEQGRIGKVENIHDSNLQPCYIELLAQFQVQANLVVPVTLNDHLWGLLIAHQCRAPRQWTKMDEAFLQQVGLQLSLAVRYAVQDRCDRKQAELILQTQFERERLLHQITTQIRKSLDLETILTTAVTQIRQVLQADRSLIFRLLSDGSGQVIEESVLPEYPVTNEMRWLDEHFPPACYEHYRSGKPRIVPDITTDDWGNCLTEFMQSVGVQSKVVAPIVQTSSNSARHVWGLLIVHACAERRVWHADEANLLQQLADQLAIAIQQAELYQRVQQLNINLEIQVRERTAQIQRALQYEEMLKRVSDRVRDSLDEQQVLQTAVAELGQALAAEACDIGLYDLEQQTVTIRHDWVRHNLPMVQGFVFPLDSLPSIHQQTLCGQSVQFCSLPIPPAPARILKQPFTILTCPLMYEGQVLGTMWIFRAPRNCFSNREIWLAEQFANQCAIALRQARLYQASQAQVIELERLNQLKDDFLSTVSHELRTPMSNIKMATHMLEVSLSSLELFQDTTNSKTRLIQRYLDILQDECQRETTLINNLLDLTRLDAGLETLHLTPLQLQTFIPRISEPFLERAQQRQQRLILDLPENLPTISTSLEYLERILLELLNNACKYTPPQETITVSCAAPSTADIIIRVTNSGIEIAPAECDRIFDRFYRIPNSDPWKHGGTGLGLALVKQLVEALHGSIYIESKNNQTHFIIQLPIWFEKNEE